MTTRRIYHAEAAVLRMPARAVAHVDDAIRALVRDLADTMYAHLGVGLAANQIGILRKVFVVDVGKGLMTLINPVYVSSSGTQVSYERCLSVPGVRVKVNRAATIVIHAQNVQGEAVEYVANGRLARCIQHEMDHLEGIILTDHMPVTDAASTFSCRQGAVAIEP